MINDQRQPGAVFAGEVECGECGREVGVVRGGGGRDRGRRGAAGVRGPHEPGWPSRDRRRGQTARRRHQATAGRRQQATARRWRRTERGVPAAGRHRRFARGVCGRRQRRLGRGQRRHRLALRRVLARRAEGHRRRPLQCLGVGRRDGLGGRRGGDDVAAQRRHVVRVHDAGHDGGARDLGDARRTSGRRPRGPSNRKAQSTAGTAPRGSSRTPTPRPGPTAGSGEPRPTMSGWSATAGNPTATTPRSTSTGTEPRGRSRTAAIRKVAGSPPVAGSRTFTTSGEPARRPCGTPASAARGRAPFRTG